MMADGIEERKRRLREGDWLPASQAPIPRPSDARPRILQGIDVTTHARIVDENEVRLEAIRSAAIANTNSDAFSFLVHRGWLKRGNEAQSTADIRVVVAERYRGLHDGSQVSPLKGQDYEIRTAGAPGFGRTVGDHALDCMRYLAEIERHVADRVALTAVQQVLWEDRWIWKGRTDEAARRQVNRVLRGLDHLAAFFGYITSKEVMLRWEG